MASSVYNVMMEFLLGDEKKDDEAITVLPNVDDEGIDSIKFLIIRIIYISIAFKMICFYIFKTCTIS